jgi:hypothetical protein
MTDERLDPKEKEASKTPTPKISGFTLVRHGVKFDYPFRESIRSMLTLVDELIVNVGRGDDATLQEMKRLALMSGGKIRIFESDWPLDDPEKRKGGLILSEQTNLALDRCTHDWCLYLQADEVLHHEDLGFIRRAVAQLDPYPKVEGLLFDYLHFYGSYDVIQVSRSAYRREVRMIRKSSGARSVGDAQSFRKPDGSKLKVMESGARVFHYGWVRTPEAMKEKTFFMDSLYHGGQQGDGTTTATGDNYRYKRIVGLRRFNDSHPGVMIERIREKNWNWDLENSPLEWRASDLKKIVLDWVERRTGRRLFEYRSYEEIR